MSTGLNHTAVRPFPWKPGALAEPRAIGSASNEADKAQGDWELLVRSAFLGECLQHGVRAELARGASAGAIDREEALRLREQADASSRRAALGWLRLETTLASYGELAAFALARCIEEAALDIRRRAPALPAGAPAQAARNSQVVPRDGDPHALSIVERGRQRLASFWESGSFCAA